MKYAKPASAVSLKKKLQSFKWRINITMLFQNAVENRGLFTATLYECANWSLPLTDVLFKLSKDAAVEGVHLWEHTQYLS